MFASKAGASSNRAYLWVSCANIRSDLRVSNTLAYCQYREKCILLTLREQRRKPKTMTGNEIIRIALIVRRHDIQHNVARHNDTQHCYNKPNLQFIIILYFKAFLAMDWVTDYIIAFFLTDKPKEIPDATLSTTARHVRPST
jgi:hypothetical protein